MNKEKLSDLTKKEWNIPFSGKIMRVINAFSLTEKTLFFIFTTIFVISGLSLLYQVNKNFLVEVPDYGGSFTEGIIGSPRFINPLLASGDIDKDLTTLIYSGLLRLNSDGDLIPDLAESYSVSDDGLVYSFTLKDDVYFHDGVRVTTDDIVFTIEKAQNPALKSPRESNWAGVNVERVDEKTINFVLRQPYSPFIQNTTLGILPRHIWKNVSIEEFPFSQFNIKPIGSGPYKINSISYSSTGIPGEYQLESFKKYSLGRPYISKIVIKSFSNERDILDAYKKGDIESLNGVSPKLLSDLNVPKGEVVLSPLPRVFGLFFNQNIAPVFVYKEVRSALNAAVDKQAIVNNVLGGYGQPINGPVPLETIAMNDVIAATDEDLIKKAQDILTAKGWVLNENGIFEKIEGKTKKATLSFSISTGNAPELKETALMLQNQWGKMGAEVEVKIFEIGDLNQDIITPRKYDSLLFGEIISRDLDLYPFWHSSQRTSPGLNIAMYTNVKADKLLENIRKTANEEDQQGYFDEFNQEIINDVPAVFTYSPYFIYIVPKKINNVKLGTLNSPSERFSDIAEWYIETNNVWEIFNKEQK